MPEVSKEARTSPPLRVSYPTVFTARSINNGTPKFGVVLMLDKTSKEHMAYLGELYRDAEAARIERWPDEAARPRVELRGRDASLFKDGDTACNKEGVPLKEKNPEYEGHWILRSNSTRKPIVVNNNMQNILDSNEVYGGCWCEVNVNVYTYDGSTGKGVTSGLNGVKKVKDDDSFGGGRPSLDQMFEASAPAATDVDPFDAVVDEDVPF